MIAVIAFEQKYDDPQVKKGIYVDYGTNLDTFEVITLPNEEYYSFVKENCYFSEDYQEYILKDTNEKTH